MEFPPPSPSHPGASDRLLSGVARGGIVLFLCGVAAAAWWTLTRIDQAVRDTAQHNLTTVMASAREATRHWGTRQQAMAAALTATRGLGDTVARLLANELTLRPRPQLADAVRHLLDSGVREHGIPGYWIIRVDETTLLHWPDSLPPSPPARMRDALDKALDGLPALGTFPADIDPTPLLCAFAPIRDQHGEMVAVLVLELPARRELAALAEETHVHSMSEVHFFAADGHVLGASSAGPPPRRGSVVAMAPRITKASTERGTGLDLDGYANHEGRRVIGIWEWDDQLDIGIAVETDARSAYHVVDTARSALFGGASLTFLLFVAALAAVTQSRRRAHAMSALQRRLAAVLESTTDPVCFADATGHAIYLNDAGRSLLGAGTEFPLRGQAVPPWARVLLRIEALSAAARDGNWAGETSILTADARELTLSQVIICHRRADGAVDFYSTIARDITERKQLERRLSEEKERAEVTLGSIGDAVVRTDARGVIEYLNPVAEQLLGCRNADLSGRPISTVVTLVHETTREPIENPVETCLREKRVVGRSNLSLLVRPDGREFAIDDSASPVTNNDHEIIGAVLVFHDVSRARTLARQLAHQASHDHLTGLVNRHEFERRVGRALTRAQQEAVTHALCFLDLDQFKVVNDTCGHVAGDELLRQLASALQKKVRRRDTLARLGGDEFGVLLEHCPPGQATRVAHDLLETVQEFRFVWEGKPFA
ncbi:MAG: diguanylate cyclase, partial [Gemmatimonadota bacterium]